MVRTPACGDLASPPPRHGGGCVYRSPPVDDGPATNRERGGEPAKSLSGNGWFPSVDPLRPTTSTACRITCSTAYKDIIKTGGPRTSPSLAGGSRARPSTLNRQFVSIGPADEPTGGEGRHRPSVIRRAGASHPRTSHVLPARLVAGVLILRMDRHHHRRPPKAVGGHGSLSTSCATGTVPALTRGAPVSPRPNGALGRSLAAQFETARAAGRWLTYGCSSPGPSSATRLPAGEATCNDQIASTGICTAGRPGGQGPTARSGGRSIAVGCEGRCLAG